MIQHIDNLLRVLEQDADSVNYPIDKDATYELCCKTLTDIEWKTIEPTTSTWVSIGYYIGLVRGRIEEKRRIG